MGNFRHWAVVLTIWVSSCSPDQGKVRLRVNTPIPVKPPMTTLTPQNLFSLMNVNIGTECYQDQVFLSLEDPETHQILQSTQAKLKTNISNNLSYQNFSSIDSVITHLQQNSSLEDPLMVDVFGNTQLNILFSGHFFRPQDTDLNGTCDQLDKNNPILLSVPQAPIPAEPSGTTLNGRAGHTATMLHNGKILVVGGTLAPPIGTTPIQKTEKAWLFDPDSKTWSGVDTSSISSNLATSDHTATLLSDGRVVIVGGLDSSDAPVNWMKIYNPENNSITPGPALNESRNGHSADLLPSGKVIIIGGVGSNGILASYETWDSQNNDPTNTSWSLTEFPVSIPELTQHKTALIGNQLFVIGGNSTDQSGALTPQSGVYIYDEFSNPQWVVGPNYLIPISHHTVNPLPNQDSLIVVGGLDTNNASVNTVGILSMTSQGWNWSSSPYPLNSPRHNHTTTILPNGSILVTGGRYTSPFNNNPVVSDLMYTNNTNSPWEISGGIGAGGNGIDSLSSGNENHTATLIPGLGIFIFGGNLTGSSISNISAIIRPEFDALYSSTLVGRVQVNPANLQYGSINLPIQVLHTNPIPQPYNPPTPPNNYTSIMYNEPSKFTNWIEIPYPSFNPANSGEAKLISVQYLGIDFQPIELKTPNPSNFYIPKTFPLLLRFIYTSPNNPRYYALYETLVFDEILPTSPITLDLIQGTESTSQYVFPNQILSSTQSPFIVKVYP